MSAKAFGPKAEQTLKNEEVISQKIGSRLSYVMLDNMKAIKTQLDQYGFCQIDGFLGDNGYAETMHGEMKQMFDRGWFETESEEDAATKIGPYKILNQDLDNRFRAKIKGLDSTSDIADQVVQNQYEIAPTVIEFVRGLTVSTANQVGKAMGCNLKQNVAMSELFVLCGEGARYDRRIENVHGWHTQEHGFVHDSRKLTAFYFCNPNYREENGGALQLEGVVTPTGAVKIPPIHDRLVLFWADKTVWSMTPSRASMISEFQFGMKMNFLAKDVSDIRYDPKSLAQWYPELRGQPIPDALGQMTE